MRRPGCAERYATRSFEPAAHKLTYTRSAMHATRRFLLGRAAVSSAVATVGSVLVACGPGGKPMLPTLGRKVVHAAAFIGQDPGSYGTERAAVELQRAANAVNQQRLGFEVRVDFMLLPPRPTPVPGQAPPGPGTPVPAPFAAAAISLQHAATGGELAGGAPPPDVVLLSSTFEVPVLLERNLIQPIEPLLKVDRSLKLEEFAPGALEAVRSRGKIAVLPLAGYVQVLLYDSALFDAAGAPRPDREWTWQRLIEVGQRLMRTGGEQEQWAIIAHNSTSLLLSLVWSHGGQLLSKDGRRSLLAEPAAREGIQLWADLLLRHRIAPRPPPGLQLSPSWSQNEIWVNLYEPRAPGDAPGPMQTTARHRAAMMLAAPQTVAGPAAQPRTILSSDVPKGRQRAAWLTPTAGLAIGAKAQDVRLALRAGTALAEHLLQAPVSFGYPVRNSEPGLLRRVQPRLSEQDAEVLSSAFGYSRGVPPELSWQLFRILSGKLMMPILGGQASVGEAARDAADGIDELLRA